MGVRIKNQFKTKVSAIMCELERRSKNNPRAGVWEGNVTPESHLERSRNKHSGEQPKRDYVGNKLI